MDVQQQFPKTIKSLTRITQKSRKRNSKTIKQSQMDGITTENHHQEIGDFGENQEKHQTNRKSKRKNNFNGRQGIVVRNRQNDRSSINMVRQRRSNLDRRQRSVGNNQNNKPYLNIGNSKNVHSLVRRQGYGNPMPYISPFSRSSGTDGCIITGSEFLTTLEVQTTSSTMPAVPGDVLKTIYINPDFMSNSRILQISELYKHYKYIKCCVEYVPNVSNFTEGTIGMSFIYDPDTPLTTIAGSDARLKYFMGLGGACIFPVREYGRTYLTDRDDTLKRYFVRVSDGDPREVMQAYFVAWLVGDVTVPDEDAPIKAIGELIMHYEIKLEVRDLAEQTQTLFSGNKQIVGIASTPFLSTALTAGSVVTFNQGYIPELIEMYQVCVIRPTLQLTINVAPAMVQTTEGEVILLNQGSVLYAFKTESQGPIYLAPSLDICLRRDLRMCFKWVSTITSSWVCDGFFDYEVFDIRT